jgi:hypothetical protein
MIKFFLFFFSFTLFAHDFEVSIATVFQNEGPYLKEWIEFHKAIGVQHFYLYNNNSQDEFRQVLAPYVEEGLVELIEWCEKATSQQHWMLIQREAMRDAALRALGVSKWVAFIDADEFIFPVEDKTLPKFLKKYEEYPAVAANWQVFGTSNIKKLNESKLMIEQLIYRTETNYHYNYFVKSIVKPEFIDKEKPLTDWNAHMLPLIQGFSTVNAHKKPLRMASMMDTTLPVDKIRIHHYTFRDDHFFFKTKLQRPDIDPLKRSMLLYYSKKANLVKDQSILIYANKIKKNMKKG